MFDYSFMEYPSFCSAQGSTQLKVGAERIEVVTRLLKDKRVGLVVNQTSCLGEQQHHLLDVLLERGIDVRCVCTRAWFQRNG